MDDLLYLSSDDLEGLAEPSDHVEAVRDAFRQRGEGAGASVPISISTADPSDPPSEHLSSYTTSYMALLPEQDIVGGYLYSVEDAVAGGDRWYMALLVDADSGRPVAFIDGASWMPLKTGAQAAVGTDALARADARSLGVIGSGRLARGCLETTITVREFEEVRVYSRTREHREAFAADLDDAFDADVTAVGSSSAAVADSDIVLTATTSPTPVFDGGDLSAGTHVSAMGQSGREHEMDVATLRRASKYVLDHRGRGLASSLQERPKGASAFLAAFDAGTVNDNYVYAELGDVVAGRVPGRETDEEITVFDSTGTGIETVASANLLYERARDAGRGTHLQLSSMIEALEE